MKSKVLISAILLLFVLLTNLTAEKVTDFTLKDIDGNSVTFSSFLGESPVVLSFWASWCKPCMIELPILHDLQAKYDTLVTVVCVSVDRPRSVPQAKSLIKSQKFSFITLFDENSEVQKLFNITFIPRLFLIDKNGEIIYDHTGYNRGDERYLEEELLKILSLDTSIDTLKIDEKSPEKIDSTGEDDS
jgi:peroxiredoxin